MSLLAQFAYRDLYNRCMGQALQQGYTRGSTTPFTAVISYDNPDGSSTTLAVTVCATAPANAAEGSVWLCDNGSHPYYGQMMSVSGGQWMPALNLLMTGQAKDSVGAYRLLGRLTAANFNVTTDNTIPLNSTNCAILGIVVTNASTSLTTAAGGVYTAASKGGTVLVAAGQVYTQLTAASKILSLTLAAGAQQNAITAGAVYLNLTTAQGSAATADVFVYGLDFVA